MKLSFQIKTFSSEEHLEYVIEWKDTKVYMIYENMISKGFEYLNQKSSWVVATLFIPDWVNNKPVVFASFCLKLSRFLV